MRRKTARLIARLIADETGASAVEYAIVASIISIAALGAFLAVGDASNEQLGSIAEKYGEIQ
ncbi:MAG: hypothetical protein ABJ239_10855 [Erythrobacter sp.]